MATATTPAWIEAEARKPARAMRVQVVTDCGQRHEYEGLFATTFDAYDDALSRFQHCARIEVQAKTKGGRHAA